jgi:ABC-type nitrate/sulfonate/bicarbonate transport system permease component
MNSLVEAHPPVMAVEEDSPSELARLQAEAARTSAARRRRKRMTEIAIRVLSFVIIIGLWQWLGSKVDPILFTTPFAMSRAAVEMIGSGELWTYLRPSLIVLLVGLFFAVALGIALGLTLARFWVLDVGLDIYITFFYAIPAVALVPVIVLWAGYDVQGKIIILVLFAVFPVLINTYQGVKNVDPKLLEVGQAFRCSERQMWRHIVLPAIVPFIVTGLRLAIGRGLIGMVLADLYTAISGIGYLIVRSAGVYRIDKMFVPVVTLGLLGIALTWLVKILEKRVAPWTANAQQE